MILSFLIIFREVLEAALIAGIVVTYLYQSKNMKYLYGVIISISAGIAASIAGAVIFSRVRGGFSGRNEEIFEGIVMIAGAILLSTMILWMIKESNPSAGIVSNIEGKLTTGKKYQLYAVVFVAILREGIEIVLFMQGLAINGSASFTGGLAGFVTAIAAGLMIFVLGKKLPVSVFMKYSNFVLILFAGGMAAYGVHELQEAGLFPVIIYPLYDLNPQVLDNGIYPLLHDKGIIGSFFKGLFGYNGNPSLLESVIWISWIGGLFIIWKHPSGKKELV